MTYCLVSNRDQVYTVNLSEIPKTEVIPSKVSKWNLFAFLQNLDNVSLSSKNFQLKYWTLVLLD